ADERGPRIPFAWSGVRPGATGARSLRVRLTPAGEDELSVTALDESGALVMFVERLVLRPVGPGQLAAARQAGGDALYRVDWVDLPVAPTDGTAPRPAVLGEGLELAGAKICADLDALRAALDAGDPPPQLVLTRAGAPA